MLPYHLIGSMIPLWTWQSRPLGCSGTAPGRSYPPPVSSHGLRCAFKVCKEHSAGFPTDSHGVSFPLAYFPGQDPLSPSLPHSVCSAFRFSQPPSGLLPWPAISLISCRIRLWDSTLQSFPLPKSWRLSQDSIPSWRYQTLSPTGCPDGLTGFLRVNIAGRVGSR